MMFAGDASDTMMPDVVKKAKLTVEVLMKYDTDACFPDIAAQVRMQDDKVRLSDLALYPNMVVADLSEGLVAFKKGESWGACDKTGQVVIAPQFESFFAFDGGLAAAVQGGKYGFIDKTGRWVIKPAYDTDRYIGRFVGVACPVSIDGKKAVINRKGEYLWQPGLFIAEVQGGGVLIHAPDGQLGFLDDSGSLISGGQAEPAFSQKGAADSF